MSTLESEVQKLAPDALIELFILSLAPLGVSGTLYFTNNRNPDGSPIVFGGQEYVSVDFKSEGWEFQGTGPFPRPVLTISNVARFLSGLLYDYNDLVGARVTRLRTFAKFLDGGAEADPDKTFAPDIYVIFQKRKHTKKFIEFVLAANADQEGVMLPRRQVLRDTCTHSYRIWNPDTATFDYTEATCPYTGSAYFNENGQSVSSPADDKPNYQLSTCCKKRFGNKNLPTRAFPGVVRVRY
ncbi:minor tail protein L [Rhizobium phage RHph_Y1_11]|nr:minor tail protein L [Rhizobium phage RHph_Y1_11]